MNEFATFWARSFSQTQKSFEGPHAKAGAQTAASEIMTDYHALIFRLITSPQDQITEALQDLLNLNDQVMTSGTARVDLIPEHDKVTIYAPLAIIPKDPSFLEEIDRFRTNRQFIRIAICAISIEIERVSDTMRTFNFFDRYHLSDAYSEYIVAKGKLDIINSSNIELNTYKREASELIENIKLHNDEIVALKASTASALAQFLEQSSRKIAAFNNSTQEADKKFEATISAARDKANLSASMALWRDKSKENRNAFIVSSITSIWIILLIGGTFIFCNNSIVKMIGNITMGLQSSIPTALLDSTAISLAILVGRYVFIAVPLIGAVWIVRFGMRIAMRSMMLMDDAKQREVMLNTYVRLVEDAMAPDALKLTMLNAIFRPLPGQGIVDIEPPLPEHFRIVEGKEP